MGVEGKSREKAEEEVPTRPMAMVSGGVEKRPPGRPRKTPVGEKYQRKPQVYRSDVYRLTATDLGVFEWLAEHRWSTRETLVEAFYSQPESWKLREGEKPSGAYGVQRITKLIRSGYLRQSKFRIGSVVPLLLTQVGYGVLHGQGMAEWAHHLEEIDPATLEHERIAQALRLQLEALGVTGWMTERNLSWANRAKGLQFVSDAQFDSGGYRWCLEVERRLKSKERRSQGFAVRARASNTVRYLYVIPAAILGAVQESMKLQSFELGLYVWRESDFRAGKASVWSLFPGENAELQLTKLLGGGFEDAITLRRKRKVEAKAYAELRTSVLAFAKELLDQIARTLSQMTSYEQALAQRNKGVLGIGAEKIQAPRFASSSLKTFQEKFSAITKRRREWRESDGIELDAIRTIEVSFQEYLGELIAIDKKNAEDAATKKPPTVYKLSKTLELKAKIEQLFR
jgi:hypothetical protein